MVDQVAGCLGGPCRRLIIFLHHYVEAGCQIGSGPSGGILKLHQYVHGSRVHFVRKLSDLWTTTCEECITNSTYV